MNISLLYPAVQSRSRVMSFAQFMFWFVDLIVGVGKEVESYLLELNLLCRFVKVKQ